MTTLLLTAEPRRVPLRPATTVRATERRRRAKLRALTTAMRPIGDGVTGRARAALTAGG